MDPLLQAPNNSGSRPELGRVPEATGEPLGSVIAAWSNEQAPHGIFTTDTGLRLTSWNQWLERHARLKADQVIGKPLVEIVPSLVERRLHHYYRDALQGESKVLSRSLHGFLLPVSPTILAGGFAHMQQSARIGPLVVQGRVYGTITIIEDVTEREWQHSVLRQSRKRSELLARTLARLIGIRDPDELVREIYAQISLPMRLDCCVHHVLEPNSQRLQLHCAGLSQEENEEQVLLDLGQGLCGTVLQTRQQVVANHLQSRKPPNGHPNPLGLSAFAGFPLLLNERLLGSLCFGSRSRQTFSEDDLQFLYTISQYAAITLDRARQENHLRASEERFRHMADTVPGLIFTATADGEIDYLNSRFYEVSGLAPGSGLGFGWLQALEPADIERVKRRWQHCLATGEAYKMECRVRDRQGKLRWYYAVARPILEPTNKVTKWYGAATDIEDLHHAHEELAQAQSRLTEHAASLERTIEQRTAELRETIRHLESFSYTVAHDLRAPIRHIETYAGMLLEEYGGRLDEKARRFLSNMSRAAHRLDALTQDVLDYTKVATEKTQLTSVDPDQVLQDVLAMNPALQPPNTEITVLRPLPRVLADPTLLSQCFSNYLSNAIKFTKAGLRPKITIGSEPSIGSELPASPKNSSGTRPSPAGNRELLSKKFGPKLRLWVEDNGIGVEPASQKKIFGIFERGRGVGDVPGTGIGLAIVTKAVERMHGSCGVESTPGEGSRFWIELTAA